MSDKYARRSEKDEAMPAHEKRTLLLYVAGQTPGALAALASLKQICEEHLAGQYSVDLIDLLKTPQLAGGDQILAPPVLIDKLPSPIRDIIGELSNTEHVLVGLDVKPGIASDRLREESELRARAEAALREREERLRLASLAADIGVWDWDALSGMLMCDDCCCELLGMPMDRQLTYDMFLQTLQREDRESVDRALRTALSDGTDYSVEYQVAFADGSIHWIHARGCAVHDDSGKPVRLMGVVTDVTEQRCQQEELACSKQLAEWRAAQLHAFISSMAEGVVLFDGSGSVVTINETGRDIFGIPPDEDGTDWSLYRRYTLDGEEIPLAQSASFRALRGEHVHNLRYRVVTPYGKDMIINVSSRPVCDSQGNIVGASNVFRDVSDEIVSEQQRQALFDREHRISETLQQALVPTQLPHGLKGVSIAARYRPALHEAQVGGDFYDVFRLDERRIGVIIGDVAGKGLNAAIRVAAARHSIRSYALIYASPAEVMTHTNSALLMDNVEVSGILTAFYGVLDTTTGRLVYATAGHEPPIACCNGQAVELEVTGAMLGVMEDAQYEEATYDIPQGGVVVMFTDGITEARTGSDLWGKEGLIESLKRVGDASAEEIAEAILQGAAAHAGGDLQDDAAIVVVGLPITD